MLHNWSSKSESAALEVLSSKIEENNIEWQENSVSGNMAGVEHELMSRLENGTQPSMVQWIIDDKMGRLVREGIFSLIEDPNGYYAKYLHPSVAEIVFRGDSLTGLPISIHVQNHMVYNNDILARFDLAVPTSWEQLISFGNILKEEGIYLIAVSDQPWQLSQLYLTIMSSFLTPLEFDEIQVNYTNIEHLKEKFLHGMEIFSALKDFANPDYKNMNWNQGSLKVANGQALTQVLGDYIIPEYPVDANITCSLPPEHNYIYWGSESIVFLNSDNAADIAVQQYMLELTTDPSVMTEFTEKKGGLPVTSNITDADVFPCMQNIVSEWKRSENKIWVGGDTWRKPFDAIGKFLSEEWNKPKFDLDTAVDRMLEKVTENYHDEKSI